MEADNNKTQYPEPAQSSLPSLLPPPTTAQDKTLLQYTMTNMMKGENYDIDGDNISAAGSNYGSNYRGGYGDM